MIGPGSATWRHAPDWRLLLGSGRALVLQVAHPTVGAGVADFSNFRRRPWSRLRRTIDSLMLQNYGGSRVHAEAKRLRDLHEGFTGVDGHGRPYSALDPDAYLWVHATLFESAMDLHATFGPPLRVSEQRQLYEEWRWLGSVLGVTGMPDTLEGFWAYFRRMVATELEDNRSVRDVLAALAYPRPRQPPGLGLPDWAWRRLAAMGSRVITLATVGTLPEPFRAQLGLQWTPGEARRLAALRVAVRLGMPLVPARLRYHPLARRARCAAGAPEGMFRR